MLNLQNSVQSTVHYPCNIIANYNVFTNASDVINMYAGVAVIKSRRYWMKRVNGLWKCIGSVLSVMISLPGLISWSRRYDLRVIFRRICDGGGIVNLPLIG